MTIELINGPADGFKIDSHITPSLIVMREYNGEIVPDDDSLVCPRIKYYYQYYKDNKYRFSEAIRTIKFNKV